MQIEFVGEKVIEIARDQTVLEASLCAGIPHFHACGGKGKCTTCRIIVLEGEENLNMANKKESKLRDAIKFPKSMRLACQTRMKKEPVKVERIIKDEAEISLYVKLNNRSLKPIALKPLGEEKYLVLFFLDIRDFTPFVETYLPFDVIYLTRKLFDIFYKAIVRFNGQIIETAGDEVYAIFGLRTSINDAADGAISAGRAILEELDNLNEKYLSVYFRKEFEIGIGIHAGKVIVGEFNIGSELRTNVMGLAVNIASRIQNSTKELNNSFVVSEDVMRQSSSKETLEIREVNLKGVSSAYKLHLLGRPYK